ncbi:MAG: hypothetical protein JWM33_1023, partial [Caulobacteraceae bacterium]|nr:hypothetical protein [Caulobacteraceae bacterium]
MGLLAGLASLNLHARSQFLAQAAPAASGARVAKDRYHLLMHAPDEDAIDQVAEDDARYYEDGLIASGPYAGYHRLILETAPAEAEGHHYITVATRDYRTFVVDGNKAGARVDSSVFNTRSVVAAPALPKALPGRLELGQGFGLEFLGDFSAHKAPGAALDSRAAGLAFQADPVSFDDLSDYLSSTRQTQGAADPKDRAYAEVMSTLRAYLAAPTTIRITDGAGNSFRYALAFAGQAAEPLRIRPEPAQGLYGDYGNLIERDCNYDMAYAYVSYSLAKVDPGELIDLHATWKSVELFAFAHPDTQPLVKALYALRASQQGPAWGGGGRA